MSTGGGSKLHQLVPGYWPVVVGVTAIVFAAGGTASAVTDHGKRISALEVMERENSIRLEHIDTTLTDLRNEVVKKRLDQLSDQQR